MSIIGQHPEIERAEAERWRCALDVNKLAAREADSDPGEWLRSYGQAEAAFQAADEAYESALLWADLERQHCLPASAAGARAWLGGRAMSTQYPGPARPTVADLEKAEDTLLKSADEQGFGESETAAYQAAWVARFAPDLDRMDFDAGLEELGIDPEEWCAEPSDPEAGQ